MAQTWQKTDEDEEKQFPESQQLVSHQNAGTAGRKAAPCSGEICGTRAPRKGRCRNCRALQNHGRAGGTKPGEAEKGRKGPAACKTGLVSARCGDRTKGNDHKTEPGKFRANVRKNLFTALAKLFWSI